MSVAVDLGDLEGRGPDVWDCWNTCDQTLHELLYWQSFRQTSEQVGVMGRWVW